MLKNKDMFEDTIKATEEIAINKFARNEDFDGKKIEKKPFKPEK